MFLVKDVLLVFVFLITGQIILFAVPCRWLDKEANADNLLRTKGAEDMKALLQSILKVMSGITRLEQCHTFSSMPDGKTATNASGLALLKEVGDDSELALQIFSTCKTHLANIRTSSK